jgi:hypothetical protein
MQIFKHYTFIHIYFFPQVQQLLLLYTNLSTYLGQLKHYVTHLSHHLTFDDSELPLP